MLGAWPGTFHGGLRGFEPTANVVREFPAHMLHGRIPDASQEPDRGPLTALLSERATRFELATLTLAR